MTCVHVGKEENKAIFIHSKHKQCRKSDEIYKKIQKMSLAKLVYKTQLHFYILAVNN